MVSEKAFDSQRYPELLISFRSLKHQNTYSSDYEKKREQALNQVKEALKNRPEEQVAALRDSAQPDINQGRQALETGKQALAQLEQQPGIPAEMLEKQKTNWLNKNNCWLKRNRASQFESPNVLLFY